jgi:allophanate hydrolase subunit 2
MMRIVRSGLRATIQDRGRNGHTREGVPPSGPADPAAFAAAL